MFVADLVESLLAVGHQVIVASFETVQPSGSAELRASRGAAAGRAWADAISVMDATSTPRSWGARVPVARLPVARTWGAGTGIDELERIARHREVLEAFGRSLDARWPIDVVHAHTGAPDGLAATGLADALGIGLLVSEHDSTLPRRLAADPRLVAAYRGLVDAGRRRMVAAVSPALGDKIGTLLDAPVPAVLPNPIRLDAFAVGAAIRRDPNELLWVGTRAEHKGTAILLEAFAAVHREHPDWHLRLIGPAAGGGDDRWIEQAADLGVGEATSFEPATDRAAVAAAMRRASIFVHPSPWETFGVVAAEAIASGLPVAATPSGGVESVVGRDGRLGEIASDLTATGLANAILAVMGRRSEYEPEAMRATMAARYGPPQVAAIAETLYDALDDPVGGRRADRLATGGVRGAIRERQFSPGLQPPSAMATSASGFRGVVVGLHPRSIERLIALPPGALASWLVVTGRDRAESTEATDRLRALAGRHLVLDQAAAMRDAMKAASGAIGFLKRRRLMNSRPAMEIDERRRVLRAVIRDVEAGSHPLVVCVDPDDVLAVLDALPTGVRLAPGSLRWLADLHDAGGELVAPSDDALLGV